MSEEKQPRYSFDGFQFGSLGDVVLQIRTLKPYGGYTAEFALELTIAEKQELITALLTLKKVNE